MSKKYDVDLFEKNGMDISTLKNKTVLDMGSGSGRFTIAFAQLGVKNVVGVDLGEDGIKIGEKKQPSLKTPNLRGFLLTPNRFRDRSF